MELIYAYSGRGIRNIQNHEFNFSNNFNVKFNEKDKKLFIKKIKNNKESFIYQLQNINENKKNKIENITLIVGKNGTGKSTILKLLGYSENQRDSEFGDWLVTTPLDSIVVTRECIGFYFWFAVYHVKGNEFIIEGNTLELINNIDFIGKEEKGISTLKCIKFYYDFYKNTIFNSSEINESSNYIRYIFYHTSSGIEWLKEYNVNDCIDIIPRTDCNNLSISEVTRLVFSDDSNIKDILPAVNDFYVQIKLLLPDVFRRKMFGKLNEQELLSVDIYSGKEEICHYKRVEGDNRQKQEYFVLLFLEILIWREFKRLGLEEYNIPKEILDGKDFDNYENRKQYLIVILNSLYNTEFSMKPQYDKSMPLNENFHQYILPIINRIEKLRYNYLSSDDVIQISKSTYQNIDGKSVEDFLKPFEEARRNKWLDGECIFISAEGMSTGEAHLYDIYASLYNEIKEKRLIEGGTYILLMDEPEARMHPEWSREFLSRLVDILSEGEFTKYHWQIIITTHSPFLLSDVPKSNIICLSKDKDCIRVDNADCGFMANIYDLLGKSFFMESPFGMLAKRIVDKKLKEIRNNGGNLKIEDKGKILDVIDFIDDEIIRESIKRMLLYCMIIFYIC